jgi:hypothetical protein
MHTKSWILLIIGAIALIIITQLKSNHPISNWWLAIPIVFLILAIISICDDLFLHFFDK